MADRTTGTAPRPAAPHGPEPTPDSATGMPPARARDIERWSTAAALLGLALVALGFFIDRRQAAFSYLAAFAYWLSLALGTLIFLMIHHAINSSWFVVLRRPAEAAAAMIPLLALLSLPLLFGVDALYPWAAPAASLPAELREAIATKRPYLNVPFFLVRAAAYFATWTVVAVLLRRWSLRQAAGNGVALARRQRTLAAGALPPVAFALTFAAFDWLMSLQPTWFSTVFGVYYFAGGAVGGLALLAVIAFLLHRAGPAADILTTSHYHALGKLLFTMLVFWGYIGFVQLLLIWIANVPTETTWFAARIGGGWTAVGALLVVGHFFIPFFALLSRPLKRRPAALAAISAWLLAMHYVDAYWLVLPALHPSALRPHWIDAAAFIGIGGAVVAYGTRLLAAAPLLPRGDPRLERSLRFTTT
ncbi:MAG TPA: hypothetical protein VF188_16595 [Longimicrobiales bacterium]